MSQLEIFDRSASSSDLELTNKTSENTSLWLKIRPLLLYSPCYHPASLTPILRDQSNSSDKEL